MKNCTELTTTQSNLPSRQSNNETGLKVAELNGLPYPQAEALMTDEMDRISEVASLDPLQGLDLMLGLMQCVNFEIYKEYAPMLVENARLTGDKFATTGVLKEDKRGGSRVFNQFLRVQETITKVGVAHTRVRDELKRRG